ncbi:MAG: hypothetical protein U0Z70_14100 [Thermomicrobiales bacterium]|jgi:hypothetical protein
MEDELKEVLEKRSGERLRLPSPLPEQPSTSVLIGNPKHRPELYLTDDRRLGLPAHVVGAALGNSGASVLP